MSFFRDMMDYKSSVSSGRFNFTTSIQMGHIVALTGLIAKICGCTMFSISELTGLCGIIYGAAYGFKWTQNSVESKIEIAKNASISQVPPTSS